jgi:hypothetical protein
MAALHGSSRDANAALSWESDVSLLTNPLIVRQMALVVGGGGAIMATLLSFIFAATGEWEAIPPILAVAALVTVGLAVLMLTVTLVVFGGRIRVRYHVDRDGVTWETIDRRALRANRLAILAGILGRSPGVAGAGMLAQARSIEFVAWDDVHAADVDARRRSVTLRDAWRPVMLIVADAASFEALRDRVAAHLAKRPPTARRRSPLVPALARTLFIFLAHAPLFTLSTWAWYDFDLFLPIFSLAFALATAWLIPLFGYVMLPALALLAVQVLAAGPLSGAFRPDPDELALLTLTLAGLVSLAIFAWRAVRGRVLPPLLAGQE